MFFPWVGLFEQVRLADVFVHYDDVQLPQGRSFITRVQLKSPAAVHWLALPVTRARHLATINECFTKDDQDWRRSHLETLQHLYSTAPYFQEMLSIVESVYDANISNVAELNALGIEKIAAYFDLKCAFLKSSDLEQPGRSSERLLAIVKKLEGDIYITGHGARNYLDHSLFETSGVRVEYMRYNQSPYRQMHGPFTPFVSILDLIANEGKDGRDLIASSSVDWKEFLS